MALPNGCLAGANGTCLAFLKADGVEGKLQGKAKAKRFPSRAFVPEATAKKAVCFPRVSPGDRLGARGSRERRRSDHQSLSGKNRLKPFECKPVQEHVKRGE